MAVIVTEPDKYELDNEALKRLKAAQQFACNGSKETAHIEADRVLCDLLNNLGYSHIVEEYNKVPKWYA